MGSKEYFKQVANQWDQMRQSFFSNNVREIALTTANVKLGEIAVDLGSGTGFITEGLLRKGLKVIAVDQSEAMIEVMKRKFEKFDMVEYRIGESDSLPIKDESVDYVFANMYLHHVETPKKAIREMVRILKPSGKVIITDLDEHNFEFLRTEQHDRWLGFKRDDINGWLTEVKLLNVQVDSIGEDCCAESSGSCESASISIFVASGEK